MAVALPQKPGSKENARSGDAITLCCLERRGAERGDASAQQVRTASVDLIIKGNTGTGRSGASVTLERYAGGPEIWFTVLGVCGTLQGRSIALWGFVVSKGSVTPRHKSAYDSHWRSLVGAASSSCCAAKMIHRLIECSQSRFAQSKPMLAACRPLECKRFHYYAETQFCLYLYNADSFL